MPELFFVELAAGRALDGHLATDALTRRRMRTFVQKNAKSLPRHSLTPASRSPEDKQVVRQRAREARTAAENEKAAILLALRRINPNGPVDDISQCGVGTVGSRLMDRAYEAALLGCKVHYYWPHSHRGSIFHLYTMFQIPTAGASGSADLARTGVLMISVGNVVHDSRMVMEGHHRHQTAMQSLRSLLHKGTERGHFDVMNIMLSILYLLGGEVIPSVTTNPQAWRQHLDGLVAIVQAASTASSAYGGCRLTLFRVRQLLLMTALWDRRALLPAVRELHHHFETSSPPGHAESLARLAMAIPTLLEATDLLLALPQPTPQAILHLLAQLRALEHDLDGWYSAFLQSPLVRGEFCEIPPNTAYAASVSSTNASPLLSLSHPPNSQCLACFVASHGISFAQMCLVLVLQAQVELDMLLSRVDTAAARPSPSSDSVAFLSTQSDPSPPSPSSSATPLTTAATAAKLELLTAHLCAELQLFHDHADGIFRRITIVRCLLMFLLQHLHRARDSPRIRMCRNMGTDLRAECGFLAWEAAVPWAFMSLLVLFDYDEGRGSQAFKKMGMGGL